MKKFFITGSSSGIGRALAEAALAAGHRVVGLSRRSGPEHPLYKHVHIDLSELDNYVRIQFERAADTSEMILVNNAGTLGQIRPVGELSPDAIDRSYRLNVIAPSVLSKLFVQHTQQMGLPRCILNISSGAGAYPVASWSTYCASKAALDMFSEVLRLDHPDLRCHSISPGIVDTEMQGEIRRQPSTMFPDRQRFIDYKEKGELSDAKLVAQKILTVLGNPERYKELKIALREVDI